MLVVFRPRSMSFPYGFDSCFGLQFQGCLDPGTFLRGEPMVPFVLDTGVQVEASCGHAEDCPHYWGWGAPMVRFPAASSLFESWSSHRGIGEPVVSWRIWVSLVKFLELLQTAY